jgi:hypothetical protein
MGNGTLDIRAKERISNMPVRIFYMKFRYVTVRPYLAYPLLNRSN